MSNSYKRFEETLSATVIATVLTVPAATTAIVKSILVANDSAGSANITVTFSPEGSGTHYVVPLTAVASKAYADLLSNNGAGPLILEAGDLLKVTSSADDVYVVVSALLVDRN
jgi:hypothetical protein